MNAPAPEPLIISCASTKGGVGKTTSVISIAGAFAYAGCAVEIIDNDRNLTITRRFISSEHYEELRARAQKSPVSYRYRHGTVPAIHVSRNDTLNLSDHLIEVKQQFKPNVIFVDLPGHLQADLIKASSRSHLTIVPAGFDEADVVEAKNTMEYIQKVYKKSGRQPLCKLLVVKVEALQSASERFAASEIVRLGLPRFKNVLAKRAAYKEIGYSQIPPHYGDRQRDTISKAIAELDALKDEIITLTRDL